MEAVDTLVRADEAASTLRKLALARLREGVAAVIDWSLEDEAWDFAIAESRFGDRDATWPALRIDDGRTVLVHINNSNPILREGTPERAAVARAGVEIGIDGLEVLA